MHTVIPNQIVGNAVALVAALLLAFIVDRVIERPCVKFGKKLLSLRSGASPTSAAVSAAERP
jgi:peptidoglycan/LPS O-acetylase OafA/YrhL